MAEFISFDDGQLYLRTDQIAYFAHERRDESGSYVTAFHMKDQSVYYTSRPISEVAEMLGAVNVWF